MSRWIPRHCSSCSTPPGRPANRRASCTPPVDTWSTPRTPHGTRSTCARAIDQVYWCTADVGWITGHSYIVYGCLPNRVPTLMYEGAPNFPAEDRFWDICERHRGDPVLHGPDRDPSVHEMGRRTRHPKHDLSKLKVLGTVGEPINPEAWMWYHRTVGGERCPIVDTWWQTETGGHMITPHPAATPTVPGSCTLPAMGIDAAIVDEAGNELPTGTGGLLVIRKPWPAMLRGISRGSGAVPRDLLVDAWMGCTPRATAHAATSADISGSWGASTT